jgi:Domain of unknown function (DUF4189)
MMEMTAFPRRAAVVTVAAVTAMTAAAVTPASAATYYGAIAYSGKGDSKGYPQGGGVVNAPTQEAADSAAITQCGQSDCKVLIDFSDCAAVAFTVTDSGGKLYSAHASTLKEAQAAALSKAGSSGEIDKYGCNKGYS